MSKTRGLFRRASSSLVTLTAILFLVVGQGILADEPEQGPIRVGITASLTGHLQAPGKDLLAGTQMWASDVNTRGALLGRDVEIVYYDDKSDPATSEALYERLITEDKVDLLLGPYGSDITFAASSAAERHGMPMVSGSASASVIWSRGYENIFQVDVPAKDFMNVLIDSAEGAGLRTVGVAYSEGKFTREVAQGVRERVAEKGMELVFEEEYPENNTEFQELISRMKKADPDLAIVGSYFVDSVAFVREAKTQQFSPRALAMTVGPALTAFGDELGFDTEGIMGVVSWMRSASRPLAYDFSFRYKEKHGRNAGVHAAFGYSAGQVLEAAVRLAGSLDNDAIRQNLREMRFRSLMGWFQVDEAGRQMAKQSFVMQWITGYRLLVLPERMRDAEIIYPFPPWSEGRQTVPVPPSPESDEE